MIFLAYLLLNVSRAAIQNSDVPIFNPLNPQSNTQLNILQLKCNEWLHLLKLYIMAVHFTTVPHDKHPIFHFPDNISNIPPTIRVPISTSEYLRLPLLYRCLTLHHHEIPHGNYEIPKGWKARRFLTGSHSDRQNSRAIQHIPPLTTNSQNVPESDAVSTFTTNPDTLFLSNCSLILVF